MKFVLLIFFSSLFSVAYAQVNIKTEFVGKSQYRYSDGEHSNRVGDSEGSAMVYQIGAKLPVKIKSIKDNEKDIWGVAFNTAYVDLNNNGFDDDLVVSEVSNASIGVFHLKDLNEKWTLLTMLGGGVYAVSPRLSEVTGKQLLVNVGGLFIRHLKPNLDLGIGAALNNSLGYPMLYPALYVKWTKEGKYMLDVSMLEGVSISLAYEVRDNLKLSYVVEVDGQLAMLRHNDKDAMFTHQYIVTGIRPELRLSDHWNLPITVGINAQRTAQIYERKLKSLWSDSNYYFRLSPYASIGLSYDF